MNSKAERGSVRSVLRGLGLIVSIAVVGLLSPVVSAAEPDAYRDRFDDFKDQLGAPGDKYFAALCTVDQAAGFKFNKPKAGQGPAAGPGAVQGAGAAAPYTLQPFQKKQYRIQRIKISEGQAISGHCPAAYREKAANPRFLLREGEGWGCYHFRRDGAAAGGDGAQLCREEWSDRGGKRTLAWVDCGSFNFAPSGDFRRADIGNYFRTLFNPKGSDVTLEIGTCEPLKARPLSEAIKDQSSRR